MKIMHGMDVAPDIEMPEGFELGDGVRRDIRCVEEWPGCADGEYDPRCCRFPKSCSATSVPNRVYRSGILEPVLMNKETAVTRSVEIPATAVEAAARALAEQFVRNASVGGSKDFTIDARAALAAALPYLAPAGDGGLREALEGKPFCQIHEHRRLGCPYCDCNEDLQRIVAAHPAAPAVPQPVDREALTEALLRVWRGRIEDQVADSPEGHCAALADAVLALLAGEQEQVESPE